jgi:hypothetical protein
VRPQLSRLDHGCPAVNRPEQGNEHFVFEETAVEPVERHHKRLTLRPPRVRVFCTMAATGRTRRRQLSSTSTITAEPAPNNTTGSRITFLFR